MGDVAIGIRPHSGWAVVVAVTGPPGVELVVRRRVEVLGPGHPRQPWHEAQALGLTPDAADKLADDVAAAARAAAATELAAVVDEVRTAGHAAVAAGIVGEPRDLPPADRILTNHALLHSAEGELYRGAFTHAAEQLGMPVTCFHPKSVRVGDRTELFAAIRKAAGPPWQADHRLATAVALDSLV